MKKAAHRVAVAALMLATAVSSVKAATDSFGVSEMYPTASGGMEWYSKWSNGVSRSFSGVDPNDAWFDAAHGSANYYVDGQGQFFITGSTPRMYVHDPAKVQQWHDVEMTVYAKRVADDGTAYAGIVGVTRSNHGTTGPELSNLCDTRGYGGRIRYDGHVDFDKETSHPNATAVANKTLWSTGMPKNQWIGYKHVTYDMPNGHVMNEIWMDLTDGANGGTWQKINSFEDDGTNMGVGGVACAAGIDPRLELTNGPRAGSESGKPNITVYWRSTNVGTNGLVYKKMSVREITAGSTTSGGTTAGGTTTGGTTSGGTTTGGTTSGGTTTGGTTSGGTTTGGTTTGGTTTTSSVISNVQAANITSSGATITWNTTTTSHSQVEYGLTTSYGSLSYQSTAAGTSHSIPLSGLKAGTVYHYRVKSLDSSTGLTAVSGDYTFTTSGSATNTATAPVISAVAASSVISNVLASNLTSSGAKITWQTTTVSHSQVEYGLTTSYGSQSYQSTATGTFHSIPLSGLKAGTLYHYRVKSLNSATGKTDVSGDYTLKTL